MKKSIIVLIFLAYSIFGQNIKFAVISNPEISSRKSTSVLDSILSRLNKQNDIHFVVLTGNLTYNGTAQQFNILKSSVEKFSKKVLYLPGTTDLRDANGWAAFNNFSEDNFLHEEDNSVFIGISPAVPLTNLSHYTLDDLDWLSSQLDTIKFKKDIYFFSPAVINTSVDNWEDALHKFGYRTIQLIISGNADKPAFRNQSGYRIFEVPDCIEEKKGTPRYTLFNISKDSVNIFDNNNKVLRIFDKTIQVPKEPIDTMKFQPFNCNILMHKDLNSTMQASTTFWNDKIYTSENSGLISCIDTTGKVLWDYDANGDIYSKPVIADRILAVSTLQGDLFTISAISGDQIQSIGFDKTITTDLSVIDYSGNKEIMIPKLSKSMSAIVFGTSDGSVLCYDLETLQKYWENNEAKRMICSKPFYVDNKILYTSRDGFLYCIDARDGILIWRWKEKEETDLSNSQILCDGKDVYVASSDGILYSIDLLLGKLEWKSEKLDAANGINLSADNKYIYAESTNNKLYILKTYKGRIEKTINIKEGFNESLDYPIDIGNNIFYTSRGFVFSLDKKYNSDKLLYLGSAPVHPITQISNGRYLISNIDGRIIIFSTR